MKQAAFCNATNVDRKKLRIALMNCHALEVEALAADPQAYSSAGLPSPPSLRSNAPAR